MQCYLCDTEHVLYKETHKQTAALTLRSEGLSWRLTSVQLSLEETLQESQPTE